jgi:predicted cupin superfamily sugar epimerase
VNDSTSYALVGCTVSPAFSFADFELADRRRLTMPHY